MTEETKQAAAQLGEAFEPRGRQYRFIIQIEGLRAFTVTSVQSLPGRSLRINYYELLNEVDDPQIPWSGAGVLKRLDGKGEVLEFREFVWEGYELLPFDHDYAESGNVVAAILLHEVKYERNTRGGARSSL